MSHEQIPETPSSHKRRYQIRVKGHLGRHWEDWFEGMTNTLEDSGEMVIMGPVPDQAQLYGLLRKERNLGLPLLSVQCTTVGDLIPKKVSDGWQV